MKNEHSDGHHDGKPNRDCPDCQAQHPGAMAYAMIWADDAVLLLDRSLRQLAYLSVEDAAPLEVIITRTRVALSEMVRKYGEGKV